MLKSFFLSISLPGTYLNCFSLQKKKKIFTAMILQLFYIKDCRIQCCLIENNCTLRCMEMSKIFVFCVLTTLIVSSNVIDGNCLRCFLLKIQTPFMMKKRNSVFFSSDNLTPFDCPKALVVQHCQLSRPLF